MLDLIALLSIPVFFALGIAYIAGCDRLKGGHA